MPRKVIKVKRPTAEKRYQNLSISELEESAINKTLVKEKIKDEISFNNQSAISGIILLSAGSMLMSRKQTKKLGICSFVLGGAVTIPEIAKNMNYKKDILILEREICSLNNYLEYAKKYRHNDIKKESVEEQSNTRKRKKPSPRMEKIFERLSKDYK